MVEDDADLSRALDQYVNHGAIFIAIWDAGETWKSGTGGASLAEGTDSDD